MLDSSKTSGMISMPSLNGVPSLKGLPSVTGIREWIQQLGHSVFFEFLSFAREGTETATGLRPRWYEFYSCCRNKRKGQHMRFR